MFDQLIFTLEDVRQVRKVSVNIDDFDLYAQEVQRNYLQKMLGDKLYTALQDDLDEGVPQEQRFIDLVNGVKYTDGRDVIFRGVKLYCAYLWLHLYMADSAISVTPIGARLFKDEYAENNEAKAAYRNARDHYISAAEGMEEPILRFLSAKYSEYPEFSESRRIKQAKNDNMTFKTFGNRYSPPDQIL
jgi:hypothetical protein